MPETTDAGGSVPDAPAEPAPTPTLRRSPKRQGRRIVVALIVVVVAGTAVWWLKTATSDPKLQFTAISGANRVEHEATGNQEGIVRTENALGTQIDIAF